MLIQKLKEVLRDLPSRHFLDALGQVCVLYNQKFAKNIFTENAEAAKNAFLISYRAFIKKQFIDCCSSSKGSVFLRKWFVRVFLLKLAQAFGSVL